MIQAIALFSALAFHIFMTHHVYYTAKDHYSKTNTIYDSVHQILPDFSKNSLLLFIKDALFSMIFAFGMGVFTEFIDFFIPIMIVRHLFIYSTILPATKDDPSRSRSENKLAFYTKGHEYDKIFSGHFATSILLSIVLYTKGIHIVPLVIYNLINAFIILSTRSHYTIDLIVAIPVVVMFYQNNIRVSGLAGI